MAALTRAALLLAMLCTGPSAGAECAFADGEYLDPIAPGCGDVQLRYTNAEVGDGLIPLGYPVPVPIDSLAPVDGYRTYASLHAAQQDLMLLHPEVHGEVVGHTPAGREIWAYRIGTDHDTTIYGQPKGAVMTIAGIHAREWQTPEVMAEIFERAVAMLDDGGIGRYLADNLRVILIPVLNVDGFLQTQRFPDRTTTDFRQPRDGRMRRKNMHFTGTGGVVDEDLATVPDNFEGVDLNRNHPFGFRSSPRNTNPQSLIYAGAEIHSEPETQALLAAAALAPTERLRLYIDFHSFTQIYFTPQTGDDARDTLTRTVADRMRAVTGNKYRYSPDPPHTAIGTTADYFASVLNIPAWTLETEPLNGGQDYGGTGISHSGFITPDSDIARVRDELARTTLLGFYHQAGPPSVVAADIYDDAGALVWSAQWEPAGLGTRVLIQSANGALRAGASYTLWLAFDKPMRWRVDGAVAQFDGQQVGLQPSIHLEIAAGATNHALSMPGGEWLAQPGPGPDGFLNYRDDAYATQFTLPADLPAAATPALLVIDVEDMAGLVTDANPATAADWRDGRWRGYEDVNGNESLAGGADCTLRLWIAEVGTQSHTLVCNAARPPEPPATAPKRRGGGKLGSGWLLLALLGFISRKLYSPA